MLDVQRFSHVNKDKVWNQSLPVDGFLYLWWFTSKYMKIHIF